MEREGGGIRMGCSLYLKTVIPQGTEGTLDKKEKKDL